MKKPAELVEAWLAIDNRDELRRALLASRVELALPQARKLERHLNDLGQGDPLRALHRRANPGRLSAALASGARGSASKVPRS